MNLRAGVAADAAMSSVQGTDEICPAPPKWALPVVIGVAVYLALYVACFPPVYIIVDERGYLLSADHILTGKVFDRTSEAWITLERPGGIRQSVVRSFLFSGILACLLPIHWKATYLVGLISQLTIFVATAMAFRRMGRSPWWAWLVLLHPSLTLHSRTIMTDVPSAAATAVVLLLLLVEPRRASWAGVVAGLALLIRLTNCWIGAAAGLQLLVDDLRGRSEPSYVGRLWRGELRRFLLPYILFCLVLLAGNAALYGGPLLTPYTGLVEFGLRHLVRYLPFYLLALVVFWPALLFALVCLPRRVLLFGATLVICQLVFFSASANFNRGPNVVETLVRCLRYQLGTVAVLCIGYPGLVDWVLRGRRVPKLLAGLAVAAGVVLTATLFSKHSARMSQQAHLVKAAYALTPKDGIIYFGENAKELFCPVFGRRTLRPAMVSYLRHLYEDVGAGDYFVFYIQPPPLTPGQEMLARMDERMIADLRAVAELREVSAPKDAAALRIFEVKRRREGVHLKPLSPSERHQFFPPEHELKLTGRAG
jgi:uncharacterized membrane protein YhaH (DUF805 family)